eukprot:scaffold18636_cov38-Prasinocladus_malaysianus.AAC.1
MRYYKNCIHQLDRESSIYSEPILWSWIRFDPVGLELVSWNLGHPGQKWREQADDYIRSLFEYE